MVKHYEETLYATHVKGIKMMIETPVNDSVKSKILQLLKQNPKANYGELADKTKQKNMYSYQELLRFKLSVSDLKAAVGKQKTV